MNNCPYIGLRPFKKNDSHLYFGRDDHIQSIKDKLLRTHFVSVVGLSGSGKSSMINAGIFPELKRIKNPCWEIVSIYPKPDAIEFLANELYDQFEDDYEITKTRILKSLKDSIYGLAHLFEKEIQLHSSRKCLIFIDQFEDVFRYKDDFENKKKAYHLVYLLTEAIEKKLDHLYIIISFRSDYIGDCMKLYDFSELISENLYLMPRLTYHQYKDIIQLPAKEKKTYIEPELLNHLLNDINTLEKPLPILQHALLQIWEYAFDENNQKQSEPNAQSLKLEMKMSHYNDLYNKSLKNCLSLDANRIIASDDKTKVKKIFKSLINTEPYHEDSRRIVSFQTIKKETELDGDEIKKIIRKFNGQLFLKIDGKYPDENSEKLLNISDDESLIEISHESLIQQWKELNTWKQEEMEAIKTYESLVDRCKISSKPIILDDFHFQKATNWLNNSPNKFWARRYSYILEIDDSFKDEKCDLIKLDMIFEKIINSITKSKKDRQQKEDQRIQTEKENIRDEEKGKRKKNYLIAGMIGGCTIIILIISIFLFVYSTSLNDQRIQNSRLSFEYYLLQAKINVKNQNFNTARGLVNKTNKVDGNVSLSRQFSRNLMRDFIDFKALKSIRKKIEIHIDDNDSVTSACCLTPKKNLLIIGTQKGMLLWFNLNKNRIVKKIKAHEKPITKLMNHPDNSWFISASNDLILKQWSVDMKSTLNQWSFRDDKKFLDPVSKSKNIIHTDIQADVFFLSNINDFLFTMTSDARYIAYGSEAIIIKDIINDAFLTQKPIYIQTSINDIALYTNNQKIQLAIATNKELFLWNNIDGTITKKISINEPLSKIIITGQGKIFGSTNKTIYEFSGSNKIEIAQLNTDICQLYSDHHENILATTVGKKIYIKSLVNKSQKIFDQHQYAIVNVFETDNDFLSIDKLGVVEKWSTNTENNDFWKEISLTDYPSSVKFSDDGNSLIIGCIDGELLSIVNQTLKNEWRHIMNRTIEKFALSTDKQLIALQSNQQIILFDIQDNKKDKLPYNNYQQMSFVPGKHELILLHSNGKITSWNNGIIKLSPIKGMDQDVFDEKMIEMTIPPEGSQIIIGSSIGKVYFVSYPELNLINILQVSREPIKDLSYNTSGKTILCTNQDDELFVINLSKPEFFSSLTFIEHQSEIFKAKFLYKSEQIVSVNKDRKMHFWDIPTETELFHIQLPVPSMSDAVTDFDCYCKSYKNCIFAVGLRNNKVAVHQFSVE